MSTIQTYWRKNARRLDGKPLHAKSHVVLDAVVCNDGFTMSVQASCGHYSQPRWKTLKNGRYTAWEIMLLQRPTPKELRGWGKDDVCGFVPTAVVDAIIERHGGLAQ